MILQKLIKLPIIIKMKKILFVFALLFISTSLTFASSLTAKAVTQASEDMDSVEESIAYLEEQVTKITNPAEKRSVYIFLASLQELLSFYDDAQRSYAQAASITAGTAQGMPDRSNEQIVLDAVRCALSSGDYQTADRYLNSSVRNSKDEEIQAYINMYSQWSVLCKAQNIKDTEEAIVMLDAYSNMKSMEVVRPAILLTLWYVTGESKYSDIIKKDYPDSIEMSVIKGEVQLLPTPFWFFVPRKGNASVGAASMAISDVKTTPNKKETPKAESKKEDNTKSKWQLGLFKTESNAKGLMEEVNKKGFNSYITSEVRPSGTTYYLVIVDEDESGNVSDKLRNAGYDCYLLE